MARRNVSSVIEPNYTPSWHKEEVWGEINPDDPVKVKGQLGAFVFKHTHVKDEEVIAVIVYGGTNGNTTFRAFYPDRVTKIVPKTKRKRRTKDEDED